MSVLFGGLKARFDPWSPEYGASLMSSEESDALLLMKVAVDTSVEMPEESWKPVACDPANEPAVSVAFVDGVRRMESNLVFETDQGFLYGGFGCCGAGAVVLAPGRMNQMEHALKLCSVQRFLFRSGGFGSAGNDRNSAGVSFRRHNASPVDPRIGK